MRKTSCFVAFALAFCCAALTLAYGGDLITIKGLITGRTADTLSVRTSDNSIQKVILTDDTKVQVPKGLGLRKRQMSWTSLIPGLKVTIKGINGPDGFVAASITFSKDDLETASMIQAGLVPTQQEVQANKQGIAANQREIAGNKQAIAANTQGIAANQQQMDANQQEVNRRFSELSDYEVKNQAVVYFPSGHSTLAPKDKAAIAQLAADAKKIPGFIIEVQGFADSTGNAAANQSLSKNRAYAVVNYMMQDCGISPRHIMAPGAMGISNPAASNETAQGRAGNRRVEIKVLVNKAAAASGH
jgi:outer membrane protein OmpA-like peptidoglycan-associated protein